MKEQFNKPKSFGEILDHTFRLSKNRFSDFFKILLFVVGPIYLIQAVIQLLSGTSLLREGGGGDTWYENYMENFEAGAAPTSLAEDLTMIVIGLAAIILFPIAQGAIMYAIDHLRKNETYTVGSVIKQAFSKFWSIVGSSLLFGVILFAAIVVPIILIFIVALTGAAADPMTGIIGGLVLFLAIFIIMALLLTRLSFYLGAVVLDGDAPGLGTSWQLTRKHTWRLAGLYIVLFLIFGAVSMAAETLFGIFLGNSVLFTLLINLITLFTTMIFSIGYTIMYMDLKVRHGADDLKEMIVEYNENK